MAGKLHRDYFVIHWLAPLLAIKFCKQQEGVCV